jgi:hypothetical protein
MKPELTAVMGPVSSSEPSLFVDVDEDTVPLRMAIGIGWTKLNGSCRSRLPRVSRQCQIIEPSPDR